MNVRSFPTTDANIHTEIPNQTRIEVPIDHHSGTYMAMLLDAEDTFDIVVQLPNGEREILWSLVKDQR